MRHTEIESMTVLKCASAEHQISNAVDFTPDVRLDDYKRSFLV